MIGTLTGIRAWVLSRDPNLAALRRAGRGAIVMPAAFAVGEKVVENPNFAVFAAFGSFSMLLLVDFGGPMRTRLGSQAALGLAGACLVCVGTLASRSTWTAVAVTAVVALGILFSGVVSSVLAGATVSLLLALILPVSIAAPASAIPERLAGWGTAAAASLLAIWVLWPAPTVDRLRGSCDRRLPGTRRADPHERGVHPSSRVGRPSGSLTTKRSSAPPRRPRRSSGRSSRPRTGRPD